MRLKKLLLIILILILSTIGVYFYIEKYNEVPNGYPDFNEYGITYNIDRSLNEYGDNYFYNQLDDIEKIYYQSFYECAKNTDFKFDVYDLDVNKLELAWKAFKYEWPQFYWWDSYQTSPKSLSNDVGRTYYYDTVVASKYHKIEVIEDAPKVEEKINEIIDEVVADDDYSTIKNIHDYIINNTTYVLDSSANQNIISVLLYNESVCAGYSKTFQYLCKELGYECYNITGQTYNSAETNSDHEWNLIKLNSNWYWVDTTWDEVNVNNEEIGPCNAYLFADDEILFIDHTPICEFDLPKCNDKSLYELNDDVAFIDEYNLKNIESKMKTFIRNGKHKFYFKFLNNEDGLALYRYFEDRNFFDFYERNIKEYYDLSTSYGYDEGTHILSFNWYDYY